MKLSITCIMQWVNILVQFVQYLYFVLYVKTFFSFVPIIEAYCDRYMLSKVVIVCYFVYIVICVCVFVTLLAGGNTEIYLSINWSVQVNVLLKAA